MSRTPMHSTTTPKHLTRRKHRHQFSPLIFGVLNIMAALLYLTRSAKANKYRTRANVGGELHRLVPVEPAVHSAAATKIDGDVRNPGTTIGVVDQITRRGFLSGHLMTETEVPNRPVMEGDANRRKRPRHEHGAVLVLSKLAKRSADDGLSAA